MRIERMRDMRSRRLGMRDGRNPYGSRGGYVVSSRRGRDYGRMGDYGRVSEYSSKHSDMSHSRPMDERDWDYGERDYEWNRDYRGDVRRVGNFEYDTYYGDGRDYGYDMNYDMRGRYDYGYDYADDYGENLTEEELKRWCQKMMSELDEREKQMFSKEAILQRAKNMGIQFDKFSEMEFYVNVVKNYTDHKRSIGENPDMAIKLAKDDFFDEDGQYKGSEWLAVYYDTFVED